MLSNVYSHQRKDSTNKQREVSPIDPLKKYLSLISRHSVLSREEEMEIAERAHRFKDFGASQKLVTSNLRLVVKIALEYYNTYLNILDLIQEGNLGLVHAVKKYNPYKGTRFSTYSSLWVRAYMLKYIMDSWSIVKVGTTQSQRRLFYSLKKEKKHLEALGLFPAPQLLADRLEAKVGDVETMEKRLSYMDISLDQPIYDEGETFMETIKADDNIEEVVAAKEKKEILEQMILRFKKMLNDKELFIFEHRIMIDEPLSLSEIGEKFTISRERVRQLENKILKKFNNKFEPELRQLAL